MTWQPKCPKCGSLNIYYTKRNKSYTCRRCGNEFKQKEDK